MVIHNFLELVIPYITSTLEGIGVLIILFGAVRGTYRFVKNYLNVNKDDVSIDFAKAMSLGLEYKLAAEIIKTVVIRNLDEFIILASVAVLRIIISFVLHWEVKQVEKEEEVKLKKSMSK